MSQKKIKNTEKKRSQDLDPNQDQFINKTMGVLDWAYAHRRPIGLLILIALVVSVAGIVAKHFMDKRNSDSSKLLAEGLAASTALVKPPAPEGDDTPVPKEEDEDDDALLTYDSSKARATEMLKRWKKVVSDADADVKIIGKLGSAISHFELGEYDDAVKDYETFLADKDPSLVWIKPAAIEGLGYALEAKGKLDEAQKRFEALMSESQGEAKRTATYQAARMAQLKGDDDGAKKLFKEVLSSYSEEEKPSRFDLVFVQSRTRLLELDPKAEVPDMPAGGMGAFDGMDPRILRQLMQAKQGAGAS